MIEHPNKTTGGIQNRDHPLWSKYTDEYSAFKTTKGFSSWLTEQHQKDVAESPEYSGGSVNYYKVEIKDPTTDGVKPYTAECNDIIEALGMNYAEGNAFKAIWRRAAQETLGLRKAGAKDDGLYDAQKVEFFGKRLVVQSERRKAVKE